jgi:guanylate kinase
MSAPHGQLVVMSGPSGTGKTTIKERLRRHPAVMVAVTVTTREPRVGEVPDRDYHFVSREKFLQMKAQGLFAETNDVFANGNLYGSLRAELEAALAEPDRVYLMEVDVTGAANLRKAGYGGVFIFIAPPSMSELERRLRERSTDSEGAIERRLARASEEMEASKAAGSTIVVNEHIDITVAQIFMLLGLREVTPAVHAGLKSPTETCASHAPPASSSCATPHASTPNTQHTPGAPHAPSPNTSSAPPSGKPRSSSL